MSRRLGRLRAATRMMSASILAICLVLPGFVTQARAASISIGLLDFSSKTPNFKVGDWVRYRYVNENSNGREDAGFQEISIVGEEMYRGEKCFWLETRAGRDSMHLYPTLVLMSYEVFNDPYPDVRFKHYMRLMMMPPEPDEHGEITPEFLEVGQRPEEPTTPEEIARLRGLRDTLGTVTIQTGKGAIPSRETSVYRKLGVTDVGRDSTIQTITETKRTVAHARKVPITGHTRFRQTETVYIKAYAVGQVSTTAPELEVGWSKLEATLMTWGTGAKNPFLDAWHKSGGFIEAPSRRQ
jgi:hypothetical protein